MQHDLRAAPVDCPTIPVTPPELPALALPHQVIYTNALMDCGAGFSKKEYYMQNGENCFLYVRADCNNRHVIVVPSTLTNKADEGTDLSHV